jgi:adenylosuccinate synthase
MPALIVVGLGYGDEGKGSVVDHLAREHNASGVILPNGGAQRAHHVVLPDGRFHRFSQFGSGFFSATPTYIDKDFLVNPHELFEEGERLAKIAPFSPWGKLRGVPAISVHADALVTTPFHVAANRIRQQARQHGTCGMGIGETVAFCQDYPELALRVRHLRDRKNLLDHLKTIQRYLRRSVFTDVSDWNSPDAQMLVDPSRITDAMEVYRIFSKVIPVFEQLDLDPDETYIFEGGQGVLLDEFHGFHPHTTWSKTTNVNAIETYAMRGVPEAHRDTHLDYMRRHKEIRTIGVMRSYMTRHGAGPFVTEDPALHERFPEAHNGSEGWQGAWRVGWTDLRAIEYSIDCMGGTLDELAVTHLDRVQGDWKVCLNYDEPLGVPWTTDREKWLMDRAWALERVQTATPQYAEFEDMTPDALLEVIEAQLDLPVTVASYGPTDHRSLTLA